MFARPRRLDRGVQRQQVRIDYVGKAPRKPKTVAVRSTVLTDVYRAQVNQVNVRLGNVVKSLTLRGGTGGSVTL